MGWASGHHRNYCRGKDGTESKNCWEKWCETVWRILGANKYIIPDFSCIRLESLHESLWPRNRNSRLFSTALTGNMQALSFSRQMIQGWNSHGMISKHLRLDQTISGATVFKSSCINLFSAWLEGWNSSIFFVWLEWWDESDNIYS